MVTSGPIIAEMRRLGYRLFLTKDHDMNVVALRRMPGEPNVFDDLMTVFYLEGGKIVFEAWPCTTNPGRYHLQNPSRVDGTAIIRPGQWRGSHQIGFHHAGRADQYEAMVQCGTIGIWRDADRDVECDYGVNEMVSYGTGLNIHHAGVNSHLVERWSAGCIVFKRIVDFFEFMALMHLQKDSGLGSKVSLTVLEWPDAMF